MILNKEYYYFNFLPTSIGYRRKDIVLISNIISKNIFNISPMSSVYLLFVWCGWVVSVGT